jgi:membrane-associated phospholipid phosphatase
MFSSRSASARVRRRVHVGPRSAFVALVALAAFGVGSARAQEPSAFDPGGGVSSRFVPGALTSSTFTLSPDTYIAPSTAAVAGVVQDPGSATGGVLFDDAVRDALRLRSPAARSAASTASDVLLFTLVSAPILENVYRVLDGDRSWGEFWRNLAVDFGALGLSWGIVELIKTTVGRERPYAYDCLRTGTLEQCGYDASARESFLSGHTALAFTGAGLVCAHAASGEDDAVSNISCAASLGLAAVTGALRIMADAHYASDVFAGAFLGLAIGYLLPRIVLEF